MPEKFENAGFFFTVRPSIHTNPSQTEFFKNAHLAGEIGKRQLCVSVWTEDITIIRMLFPCQSDCCVFKFLRRGVNRKHLMHFQ